MNFKLLYQGSFGAQSPTFAPPPQPQPLDSVELGDDPRYESQRFVVPLRGFQPGVKVGFAAVDTAMHPDVSDFGSVYSLAKSGQSGVYLTEGDSVNGRFKLSTPSVPDGLYMLWVATYSE